MGIKNLTKLINETAPGAVREFPMKQLTGRKVAVDASMAIYQFLVAVRSSESGGPSTQLTNAEGEVTSHIQGLFNRTIRMLENGVKPCFVFDGKPPTLKSGELAKRRDAKEKALEKLKEAEEAGKVEDIDRYSKRTVSKTREHEAECRKLLRLMGIPVVEAPCEAEAQCAALAAGGKVFAAASEDMDTLTFGAPMLVRRLTFTPKDKDAKKPAVMQIDLKAALEGLELSMEQFVDLCILCGCDYCDSIKGVGPMTALKLIHKHKSLEEVFKNLPDKFVVPDNLKENYTEARRLFVTPDVTPAADIELKWTDCDEAGLTKYLVEEKGFGAERVARGIVKLKKAKSTSSQSRMDSFFTVIRPASGGGGGGGGGGKGKRKTPGKGGAAKRGRRK